jgi:hypothetical protein
MLLPRMFLPFLDLYLLSDYHFHFFFCFKISYIFFLSLLNKFPPTIFVWNIFDTSCPKLWRKNLPPPPALTRLRVQNPLRFRSVSYRGCVIIHPPSRRRIHPVSLRSVPAPTTARRRGCVQDVLNQILRHRLRTIQVCVYRRFGCDPVVSSRHHATHQSLCSRRTVLVLPVVVLR